MISTDNQLNNNTVMASSRCSHCEVACNEWKGQHDQTAFISEICPLLVSTPIDTEFSRNERKHLEKISPYSFATRPLQKNSVVVIEFSPEFWEQQMQVQSHVTPFEAA
jgi:hypothetical protein